MARMADLRERLKHLLRRRKAPSGYKTAGRYPLICRASCAACGYDPGPNYGLEHDHIVDLVADGYDHPHNLIAVCGYCHRYKPYYCEGVLPGEYRLRVLQWYADGGAPIEHRQLTRLSRRFSVAFVQRKVLGLENDLQ